MIGKVLGFGQIFHAGEAESIEKLACSAVKHRSSQLLGPAGNLHHSPVHERSYDLPAGNTADGFELGTGDWLAVCDNGEGLECRLGEPGGCTRTVHRGDNRGVLGAGHHPISARHLFDCKCPAMLKILRVELVHRVGDAPLGHGHAQVNTHRVGNRLRFEGPVAAYEHRLDRSQDLFKIDWILRRNAHFVRNMGDLVVRMTLDDGLNLVGNRFSTHVHTVSRVPPGCSFQSVICSQTMHQHLDETLPTQQHRYAGSDELPQLIVHRRREGVFLLLAGLFLGTLAMLNILGITRFIKLFELTDSTGELVTLGGVPLVFAVAVGVLPYPLTFLCTDFISELYGRRRANLVVWIGLILNLWVVFILWIGGALPGFEATENGNILQDQAGRLPVYYEVRNLAFGAVTASMIAYLIAQLVDVQVFHFWKRLTRGKHLWIRNNGSTLVSQLVDTTAVILITHYYAHALPVSEDHPVIGQLLVFIATGYVFKLVIALLDTIPFVYGSRYLARYLRLPPPGVHESPETH